MLPERRQVGIGIVKLFCWEILGSAIHVDVALTHTSYLTIATVQVTLLHGDNVSWWQWPLSITLTHCKYYSEMVWVTWQSLQCWKRVCRLCLQISKSQSDQASMGCAEETNLIHGSLTSKLIIDGATNKLQCFFFLLFCGDKWFRSCSVSLCLRVSAHNFWVILDNWLSFFDDIV